MKPARPVGGMRSAMRNAVGSCLAQATPQMTLTPPAGGMRSAMPNAVGSCLAQATHR
jgi:hypothetical protein